MMARMLGRTFAARCPVCRTAPGPDCSGADTGHRRARAVERRELRADVLAQWRDDEVARDDDDELMYMTYTLRGTII